MFDRQHHQDFEAEERQRSIVAPARLLRSDDQFRLFVSQQRDGITVETRDEIDFDFRPALAECVHHRHQPIEAGVAFERDPQLPARVVLEPAEITFGVGHQRERLARQRQQTPPGGGVAQSSAGALE